MKYFTMIPTLSSVMLAMSLLVITYLLGATLGGVI